MSEHSVVPRTRAGDPFPAAAPHHDVVDQDRPHACNDGWVSMEVEALDPDTGEETFEEALYLCRKCAKRS